MQLSDVLSGFALLVSMFVAGWTVFRDVIQKPKFRITVGVKSIYQAGRKPIGPDLYLEALNMGPINNRIGLVFARPSWFARKFRGMLNGS
jgi:hypothetical protein